MIKLLQLGQKKLICFSGTFLENDVGGRLFVFYFIQWNAIKRCIHVISEIFLTFSMRTSQSTNKMVANDSRPKLTIRDK